MEQLDAKDTDIFQLLQPDIGVEGFSALVAIRVAITM